MATPTIPHHNVYDNSTANIQKITPLTIYKALEGHPPDLEHQSSPQETTQVTTTTNRMESDRRNAFRQFVLQGPEPAKIMSMAYMMAKNANRSPDGSLNVVGAATTMADIGVGLLATNNLSMKDLGVAIAKNLLIAVRTEFGFPLNLEQFITDSNLPESAKTAIKAQIGEIGPMITSAMTAASSVINNTAQSIANIINPSTNDIGDREHPSPTTTMPGAWEED